MGPLELIPRSYGYLHVNPSRIRAARKTIFVKWSGTWIPSGSYGESVWQLRGLCGNYEVYMYYVVIPGSTSTLFKKITLFTLIHSLRSDVSDHFFWSEYRVNRTKFHSLSSEFHSILELESSWIHSSTSESLHSRDGVNYSLDFF